MFVVIGLELTFEEESYPSFDETEKYMFCIPLRELSTLHFMKACLRNMKGILISHFSGKMDFYADTIISLIRKLLY